MTKPVLKCKERKYFEVDSSNLEKFIFKVYGQQYEVVACEVWSNDSQHSFTVKKEKINTYYEHVLKKFLDGAPEEYSLRTILTDLCNKDFIEPGEYLVTVCW